MTAVLVSNPHVAAVSAGLAECFAETGQLAGYFTGVAFSPNRLSGRLALAAAEWRPVLRNRILTSIPSHLLHSLAPVELAVRLAAPGLARLKPTRFNVYDTLFEAHDLAVACAPWPRDTTAVYAYEDAALRTFHRARRRGIERIWDLPTPHYLTTEAIFRDEARRWPEAAVGPPHREPDWKRRRKDDELALATKVAVASAFTRASLERVATQAPIVVGPYGFPVEDFVPRPRTPGRFRVLSVGAHDLRKGTPYLLEAWKRAAIPDAELHLIGPLRLGKGFVDSYAGSFTHWPHLPKRELAARYAAADLLVFPTLGDGFGLVIQEAMCCATPVVTTPCGGGPECITDGADGWIVPPRDVDALVERLRDCAANRDRTAAAGRAARARAERWTWRDASAALMRGLEL